MSVLALVICIGDYLNPDYLPAPIQYDNLHLISAESEVTSKPLRYDVVKEKFELWCYEEEEAATLTVMEESVNPKDGVLRKLTT
jgi:hypothetical protein